MSMQDGGDDDTDDWLIGRSVSVDLLSCNLGFKVYAMSILFTSIMFYNPPRTISTKFTGFLMPFLQPFVGNGGLGTITQHRCVL